MAHIYSRDASRRTAVFTAIVGLHMGAFLLIVAGLVPRPIPKPPWGSRAISIQPKPPPPVPVEPGRRAPYAGFTVVVERPVIPFPDFENARNPPVATESAVAPGASAGSGPVDYQAARLRTPEQRIAPLVSACYPASSRRLGEEGKASARVVLDARGSVMSWSLHASSGFARLDVALGCVIKHFAFVPARRDGQSVASVVLLPIVFRLN